MVGAVREPCSNNATEVPGSVVDGCEDSSVLWVDKLGDQQWGRSVSNGNTETKEETSSDEHVDVDTDTLESDAESHDTATDGNTDTTTKDIGSVWNNGNSAD